MTDLATRRLLLRRAGLALLTGYLAPAMIGSDLARASGASDASRGSRPSDVSRPSRAAVRPEWVAMAPADIAAQLRATGYEVLQAQPVAGGVLYRLRAPSQGRAQARAALEARFPGLSAQDNTLYRPEAFECDAGGCAAHGAIGWSAETAEGPSAPIGMIDTGVNPAHEALAGQALQVIAPDLGARPPAGQRHGTAVAALLIGRADSRTPGLIPQARLIAIEAFHNGPSGAVADAFALSAAIDQLIAAQVRVINLSFSGGENAILHKMTQAAVAAGIAVVAAAGNGGAGAKPAYPAAWPEVIAVTAVDHAQQPYRRANRGDYIDFAAPGVNLWAAASISGGRLQSGSSFAAPFVTAALARRIGQDPQAPLAAHLAALRGCAKDLGDAGVDPVFGHGLISVSDQCDDAGISAFREIK